MEFSILQSKGDHPECKKNSPKLMMMMILYIQRFREDRLELPFRQKVENSVKFREYFIRISAKFDQHCYFCRYFTRRSVTKFS